MCKAFEVEESCYVPHRTVQLKHEYAEVDHKSGNFRPGQPKTEGLDASSMINSKSKVVTPIKSGRHVANDSSPIFDANNNIAAPYTKGATVRRKKRKNTELCSLQKNPPYSEDIIDLTDEQQEKAPRQPNFCDIIDLTGV
jgi:hypothetical protein